MSEGNTDITQSIFSPLDIHDRIGSIFPDSAVLDIQFNIVSISSNILEITGYKLGEIHGKSISIFSVASDFKSLIADQLQSGYFEERAFDLRSKNGETLHYRISGFYMGLIADINGLIVLKFKNLDEIYNISNELKAKTQELDDFIYSSSHSLRGPLATLKGLINLVGLSKKPEEIDYLVKEMNVFADKLDDKLHQLIYVAESDKTPVTDEEFITIESISQSLSISAKEASVDFTVNFYCSVADQTQVVEKGQEILAMLNNLVLFFCQQPKTKENILALDSLSSTCATEIMIRSKGFLFDDSLIEKIKNVNFGYAEILNFPELLNYYATKKIMYKLNGNVQFMLISSNEVVVLMTIPRDAQLSLF